MFVIHRPMLDCTRGINLHLAL